MDTGELETLKSNKIELEESVAALQESVRLLQTEQRQIEDVEAKFQKQRVSGNEYSTCHGLLFIHACSRGTPYYNLEVLNLTNWGWLDILFLPYAR